MLIQPQIMRYSWGARGWLRGLFGVEGDDPCAQAWLGCHPKGTAMAGVEPLPLVLGRKGLSLGFMLKLLDIAEPLSIQAHPDQERASELHKADPANFPDPFSKPEMLIALDEVELLAGPNEDPAVLTVLPYSSQKFKAIAKLQPDAQMELVRQLFVHLKKLPEAVGELVVSLDRCFKGDVGLLLAPLLKMQKLRPLDCMLIKPNTVHCYLKGRLAQTMKCSDNVVRLGLTKKHRAVSEVDRCRLVDLEPVAPEKFNLVSHYRSAMPLLNFCRADLSPGEETVLGEHALVVVLGGEGRVNGQVVRAGSCLLVGPEDRLSSVSFVGAYQKI